MNNGRMEMILCRALDYIAANTGNYESLHYIATETLGMSDDELEDLGFDTEYGCEKDDND